MSSASASSSDPRASPHTSAPWLTAANDTEGCIRVQLAHPREGVFPHVDQACDQSEPFFPGTVTEFVARHSGKPHYEELVRQTRNRVKRCPFCKKPNAFTLAACNGCGQSLGAVEESFTNNIFTGFIYGIQRGPFPFTISIRSQTERFLVFDDLLQCSSCHLNCIPCNTYIPDIRSLFEAPRRGVTLIKEMFQAAWEAAEGQYLTNKSWKEKFIADGDQLSNEELKTYIFSGFNFPPSQYQLHLQFVVPPLLPFHSYMHQCGKHFTHRRFIPYDFMVLALEAMAAAGKQLQDAGSMTLENIILYLKKEHNIDYDSHHATCCARYTEINQRLAKWNGADFESLIVNGSLVISSRTMAVEEGLDVSKLHASDKLRLQNYGRPYTAEGNPTGTYYKFPKQAPLPVFPATSTGDRKEGGASITRTRDFDNGAEAKI